MTNVLYELGLMKNEEEKQVLQLSYIILYLQ